MQSPAPPEAETHPGTHPAAAPEAETHPGTHPPTAPEEPAPPPQPPQQAPPPEEPQPFGAGTAQAGSQEGAGGGRAGQFAQRADAFEPNASAFAGQLAAGFRTPSVLAALIAGGVAALGCFVFGLILAVALPDESFIGSLGNEEGLITEAFAQTVGLLLVKFGTLGDETARIAPMLFVLVPIAACAAGAFSQAGRLRGLAPRWQLASGAAVGLSFGLLMLIAAVATGDLDASVGSALLLGVIWGALGGVLGVSFAGRGEGPQASPAEGSPQVQLALRLLGATLKPLAALLVIAALIGTAAWWIGSFKDDDAARAGRSLPVSLVENTLYAGEHGVNYAALGAGTQFTDDGDFDTAALAPIPVAFGEEVGGEFRLFDFSDELPAYLFVPLLIVLMALPVLLALYAGFAAARAAGARRPEQAAAWGALVGPVWAISLAVLDAMHVKVLGQPDGASLFGIYLLAGAALGAIGGLLSAQAGQPGAEGQARHG